MALRRIFSLAVVESDKFYSLTKDAQTLYFHWVMNADDDGFVNCPKRIASYLAAGTETVQELARAGYVLIFDSGAVVIKDWLSMNTIRKDRYNETEFTEDLDKLDVINNVYVLKPTAKDAGNHLADIWQPVGNQLATSDGQNGNQLATQYNITKDNLTKEDSRAERVKPRANVPTPREVYDYYRRCRLSVSPERFWNLNENKGWQLDGKPLDNWQEAYWNMGLSRLPDEVYNPDLPFVLENYKNGGGGQS